MPNKRLLSSAVAIAVLVAASLLAVTASAKPERQEAPVTLGFITKFPVDFFFTLQNAAKKWDKATPGAKVIFAQGKSGTDDAGEIAAIRERDAHAGRRHGFHLRGGSTLERAQDRQKATQLRTVVVRA